jgi:hypothetical protein
MASGALSAVDGLRLWEEAGGLPPARRALALARVAAPGLAEPELAALPVGRRDALLLSLRAATFGDQLTGYVPCPECGTAVESTASCAGLIAAGYRAPEPEPLTHNGYVLVWRRPTAGDLAAAGEAADPDTALRVLLERCVRSAIGPDGGVAPVDLPAGVRVALGERMLECDPLAEVLFALHCNDCGARWESLFDICGYLWAELVARAWRLLADVHTLASAYGWTEAQTLSLSEPRRQAYLRMVRGE